ncbi:MAG: peptide-methionine (S)-S-oxide reductase [Colwellia sp.]|jgi:peptide-methionine (S)-S-oxide reductase|nr:MAG: peptide-methionine (S)-S-oxide reductase [Colwellia sp.]PHR85759.1 MAG: peptide-methionine (S)-S-oxide reductase [Colwellia sp.]
MTNITHKHNLQRATVAGGCFWCIEAAFSQVKGIHSAISGYMGGHIENPTYEDICTGNSGHAEVVQLNFDAREITYQEIIEIFFTLHNPTQLNRQGNDIGSQYRSTIFYHNESQQAIAEQNIRKMRSAKIFEQEIVTQVCPAEHFYIGEEYHQGYASNNPQNQYCQVIVSPKLAKFRQTFIDKLK